MILMKLAQGLSMVLLLLFASSILLVQQQLSSFGFIKCLQLHLTTNNNYQSVKTSKTTRMMITMIAMDKKDDYPSIPTIQYEVVVLIVVVEDGWIYVIIILSLI